MTGAWPLLVWLALSADPRAQLQAVRTQKAEQEAAARALEQREESFLTVLDQAEQGWVRAEAAAREAEAARAAAAERLDEARRLEEGDRARFTALQEELGPRLRARARMGDASELRLLAASTSLHDLSKRRYLWARLTASDLRLLSEAREALQRHEQARVALEREAAEVERLAGEARKHREELAERRAERRALLGVLRSARSLHERAAAEAARQEAKLAEFVAALPPAQGAPVASGFARLKGTLPLPVSGTLSVGFGPVVNPRFNTVTVQRGVDVRAQEGALVRAVAAGRVVHAGWFKGYGNLVIVDQGDRYHTLFAHLASMTTAIGEEVQAGTPLGVVGDSGTAKGAYLYFELRQDGHPVDPRGWFRP
jgi:septal ring factor EnvC (AmiA/AmiB activator)